MHNAVEISFRNSTLLDNFLVIWLLISYNFIIMNCTKVGKFLKNKFVGF